MHSPHTPKGPNGPGLSREELTELASRLWRFFTRTAIGAVIAIAVVGYALFALALFAVPRITLYMAQVKPPGEEEKQEQEDEKKSCLALVVEAKESCLGDPALPAAGGDYPETSMADATPISILVPDHAVDGYFENYYDLTVKLWERAVRDAPDDAERTRRRCITQIVTDRYGSKNTFVAFTGDASVRDEIKSQIGWFVTPIAQLKGPDYIAKVNTRSFAPLLPSAVKETCGD